MHPVTVLPSLSFSWPSEDAIECRSVSVVVVTSKGGDVGILCMMLMAL